MGATRQQLADRAVQDERLRGHFATDMTNEEIAVIEGTTTRVIGCHRTRLRGCAMLHGANQESRYLDGGDYMAAVARLGMAGPQDCHIKVVRPRPLPTDCLTYARQSSASALCVEVGDKRGGW